MEPRGWISNFQLQTESFRKNGPEKENRLNTEFTKLLELFKFDTEKERHVLTKQAFSNSNRP